MDIRQAITVKYLDPTNHRGSRYKATAEAGSLTVPWDYAKNPKDNAYAAGMALAHMYGWDKSCDFAVGALPGGGYVLVATVKKEGAK
jgi:hypothetical protein